MLPICQWITDLDMQQDCDNHEKSRCRSRRNNEGKSPDPCPYTQGTGCFCSTGQNHYRWSRPIHGEFLPPTGASPLCHWVADPKQRNQTLKIPRAVAACKNVSEASIDQSSIILSCSLGIACRDGLNDWLCREQSLSSALSPLSEEL